MGKHFGQTFAVSWAFGTLRYRCDGNGDKKGEL